MHSLPEEASKLNAELYSLMNKYFLGTVGKDEFHTLEELLKNDPAACREYIEYSILDAELRSFALEGKEFTKPKKKSRRSFALLSLAAALLISGYIYFFANPPAVGHIQFSESNESSKLYSGTFNFEPGMTLKLKSGADISINEPVQMELLTDMQAVLLKGSVSVYVRESAKGFRLDTVHGYAVDHGTRFNVDVASDGVVKFHVVDGEIALRHNSGKETVLREAYSSLMSKDSMSRYISLSSSGNEATVVENPRQIPSYATDERFLMVKSSGLGYQNSRRSFFAFKLHSKEKAASTRMLLNYVPTNMGDRKSMPAESEFELYGIPDGQGEKWKRKGMSWKEAPKLEEMELLATFKISINTERKPIIVESEKLFHFISKDKNGELGFVLSCKTAGGKMIHGFAGSKHGEAEGPLLELMFLE